MTIVADSSWVGGNYQKLNAQTYRHRSADFSGSLLYFTPKGIFVAGYRYVNGKIKSTIAFSGKQLSESKDQSSINNSHQTLSIECSTNSFTVYTGISCISAEDPASN